MRLDGWKRIAAHFGKERSTVMRWANERDLPVYRIPGEKRSGVYAMTEELDAWLLKDREADSGDQANAGTDAAHADHATPEPDAVAARPDHAKQPMLASLAHEAPAKPRRMSGRAWSLLAVVLVAVIGLGWFGLSRADDDPAAELPDDPAISALYLEAKTDWSERSSASISISINKLRRVIAAQPDFAPAYAAMADSYILAQEFGEMDSGDAFAKAEVAYDTALRIAPGNADALRARGFVEYWWKGDLQAARRDFGKAMSASPDNAQTHFWYGNILTDAGDFDAGLTLLNKAWLLSPNVPAIRVDLAWAKWSAGDQQSALAELEALQQRYPDMVTLPDYLAVMHLAEGDIEAFIANSRRYGELRQSPQMIAQAQELARAAQRGAPALAHAVTTASLAEIEDGSRRELLWPAFVASALGQDAMLADLLVRAKARRERWYNAGMTNDIRRRYRQQPAMLARLDAVSALD